MSFAYLNPHSGVSFPAVYRDTKTISKAETPSALRRGSSFLMGKFKVTFKPLNLFFVFLGATVYSLLLFDFSFSDSTDAGRYYSMGLSLVNEGKILEYYDPSEPETTRLPPLLPAICAASYGLYGKTWVPMQSCIYLFWLASFIGLYRYASIKCKEHVFPYFILIAFNINLIEFSHSVLTEIPYFTLTLYALYLLNVYHRCDSKPSLYASAVLTGLAFLFRPIGLSLIISAVITLFIWKRIRLGFTWLGIVSLVISPWIISNLLSGGTPTGHLNDFFTTTAGLSALAKRIIYNIASLGGVEAGTTFLKGLHFTLFMVGEFHVRILTVVSLILFLLIITGYYCAVRKKEDSLEVTYCLVYYSIYLLWSSAWRNYRFDLVMIPLICLFMFRGIQWLSTFVSISNCRRLILTVVTLLTLNNFVHGFPLLLERWPNNIKFIRGDRLAPYTPEFKPFVAAAEYAKENIPRIKHIQDAKISRFPDSSNSEPIRYPYKQSPVFMTARFSVFFVLSGHKAVRFPNISQPKELIQYCRTNHIQYIIADTIYGDFGNRCYHFFSSPKRGEFEVVYDNEKVKIIKIKSS